MLDEVLVSVFRAPHSYTGEDVIEISCHGGVAASSAIIRLLLATGKMRPAERGEFTRRAVLNGKLDLAQAEAIPDLVRAPSEMARQKAAAQLFGAFSRRIDELRGNLLAVQTDLTAALEFGDDLPAACAESTRGSAPPGSNWTGWSNRPSPAPCLGRERWS